MSTKKLWSDDERAIVRRLYPDTPTGRLAKMLKRPMSSVYQQARKLGLFKSAAYLAGPHACRLRRDDNPGIAFRFKPGQVPFNKGLRRPKGWAPGRMKETQFKKGVRQGVATKLWKPIGTERISKDGYLERKINNDLPLQKRWRGVHLIMWEAVNATFALKTSNSSLVRS